MAKKKLASSAENSEPTFEEALSGLEETVRVLEEGKLGLDESLQEYEKGVQHLKRCHQLLEKAEQKIELLAGISSTGEAQTEKFDEDPTSLENRQKSRSKRRSSTPPEGDEDVDSTGSLF
tara:strand:+ start:191 stop:550 length:360 start_codon:yes stop_codon:yes gene_type:complete